MWLYHYPLVVFTCTAILQISIFTPCSSFTPRVSQLHENHLRESILLGSGNNGMRIGTRMRAERKMTSSPTSSPGPPDATSELPEEDIFGSEFMDKSTSLPSSPSQSDESSTSSSLNLLDDPKDSSFYLRKNKDGVGYTKEVKRNLKPEDRAAVMSGYDQMRASFIEDSIFVSVVGLSVVWWFGTFKDAVSFGVGTVLGAFYAILLSSYVEKLGTDERTSTGNLRFVPVVLLIAIYGKNKEYVNIIPELLGFSCYQVGSFLQAFNEDAYSSDGKK